MSKNGEIYTTGKNFTLPPGLTGWTNFTSVALSQFCGFWESRSILCGSVLSRLHISRLHHIGPTSWSPCNRTLKYSRLIHQSLEILITHEKLYSLSFWPFAQTTGIENVWPYFIFANVEPSTVYNALQWFGWILGFNHNFRQRYHRTS